MRILLVFLLIIAPHIHARPLVNQSINEYSVTAKNVSSLVEAVNKASPVRQNGDVFHAHTETYIKWTFWWNNQNDGCKLSRVETEVDITYIFPRLNKSSSGKKVIEIWEKYYSALVIHENGHAEIAIEAAREIESSLLSMPEYRNCNLLSEKANMKAQEILDHTKPKHEHYDRKTRHGKSQGAYLDIYL